MNPTQKGKARSPSRRMLERRVRAALEAVLQRARDEGCADPVLYIEPESGLHVMDRQHPDYENMKGFGSSRPAIVFSLSFALPPKTDAGGW